MKISIIVAMTDDRVIGIENRLPWHIPEDFKWFRRHTLGKPVVMGRKTWESIGRPLPDRTNIVISRDPGFRPDGCTVVPDLDQALVAAGDAPEVMVIGGASIYAQFLPRTDRLYLTLVHAVITGDAWFPAFEPAQWREIAREPGPGGDWPCDFVVLERIV